MWSVTAYGKAFLDKVVRPIIVSQGRELVSRQVRDTRRLEDDIVYEREEKERGPGSGLLGVDIRRWVLCQAIVRVEGGTKRLGQDELWDRMECIELE